MIRNRLCNLSFVTVVCVITSAIVSSCIGFIAQRSLQYFHYEFVTINFASGDCWILTAFAMHLASCTLVCLLYIFTSVVLFVNSVLMSVFAFMAVTL